MRYKRTWHPAKLLLGGVIQLCSSLCKMDNLMFRCCVQGLQKILQTPMPKVWARYMMNIMRGNHQRDFFPNILWLLVGQKWSKMPKFDNGPSNLQHGIVSKPIYTILVTISADIEPNRFTFLFQILPLLRGFRRQAWVGGYIGESRAASDASIYSLLRAVLSHVRSRCGMAQCLHRILLC